MKIIFTGGGSGGHILPLIAITREIRKLYQREKKLEFFYIGPRDDFVEIFLPQEDIQIKNILSGKLRRYLGWKTALQNAVDILFKIPVGIIQAFLYIFFVSPDVIISKGGFGSIPAVIAGWIFRVPIFMQESDIAPGLTNKFLSRFAVEMFVSFRRTEFFNLRKMVLVGNPIRIELLDGTKEEAKKIFELMGDKPVVLILGGSQGAQRINDKILDILPELLKSFELIHQCGDRNIKEVKPESFVVASEELQKYYHLYPFLKEGELKHAYAAADIIISRAGAGSIFEIAAVGKPSILVPLPESAQDHQIKNAYAYAEKGAAIVMEDENFTPHFFLERLKSLFLTPSELEKMKEAAKEFARPQAAKVIAAYILEFLKE